MEQTIAVTASGDNTIIPAQGTNRRIVLKELFLAGLGAVSGHIKSGVSGTDHLGSAALQFPFVAGGGFFLKGNGRRWTGDANQPMVLNLSLAVGVVGHAVFDVEPAVQGSG